MAGKKDRRKTNKRLLKMTQKQPKAKGIECKYGCGAVFKSEFQHRLHVADQHTTIQYGRDDWWLPGAPNPNYVPGGARGRDLLILGGLPRSEAERMMGLPTMTAEQAEVERQRYRKADAERADHKLRTSLEKRVEEEITQESRKVREELWHLYEMAKKLRIGARVYTTAPDGESEIVYFDLTKPVREMPVHTVSVHSPNKSRRCLKLPDIKSFVEGKPLAEVFAEEALSAEIEQQAVAAVDDFCHQQLAEKAVAPTTAQLVERELGNIQTSLTLLKTLVKKL